MTQIVGNDHRSQHVHSIAMHFTSELSCVDICEKLLAPPMVLCAKACENCCDLNVHRAEQHVVSTTLTLEYSNLILVSCHRCIVRAQQHRHTRHCLRSLRYGLVTLFAAVESSYPSMAVMRGMSI